MTSLGYFTEIEQLKLRIKELEKRLDDERQENRETFLRMKESHMLSNHDYQTLKDKNQQLIMENMRLQEQIDNIRQTI